MDFKRWFSEWEGAGFPGAPGPTGTGNYGNIANQSIYNGHGTSYGEPSSINKVEKMYKLRPPFMVKRMKKNAPVDK